MNQNQTSSRDGNEPATEEARSDVIVQTNSMPGTVSSEPSAQDTHDIAAQLRNLESSTFSEPVTVSEPVPPAAPEPSEPAILPLSLDTNITSSPVPNIETVVATAAETVKTDISASPATNQQPSEDISVSEDGTLLMAGQQPAALPVIVPAPIVEPLTEPVVPQIPVQAAPGEPEPVAPVSPEINLLDPIKQPIAAETTPEPLTGIVQPTETVDEEQSMPKSVNVITGEPEEASATMTPLMGIAAISEEAAIQTPKPPKKPKPIMLFFVVGAVIALFASVAVAAYILQPKKTDETKAPTARVANISEPKVIQASSVVDYVAVCDSGTVTNAADYTGSEVHPTVVFEKQGTSYKQASRTFKDASLVSVSSVQLVQLVGCVSRDESFAGNVLKTCPLADTNKVTVNVEYISAKYNVDTYEAKSGKKVGSRSISTTSSTCPDSAFFTTPDPKVFAFPETVDIETAVVAYSAKN